MKHARRSSSSCVVLLVLSGTFYVVKETDQVIITQFGKPVGDPVADARA